MKQVTIWVPDEAEIQQAYARAQAAADKYFKPEEVRPGIWLCPRGRIYRAVHLGGQAPKEKHAAIMREVQRFENIAQARQRAYNEAVRTYEEMCDRAEVKPTAPQSERCRCEGCRIFESYLEVELRLPEPDF